MSYIDDEEQLDVFREHFEIAHKALQDAIKSEGEHFYLNIFDELSTIMNRILAFEGRVEGEFVFEEGEGPQELLEVIGMDADDLPPTPETHYCPSCGSVNIRDVSVKNIKIEGTPLVASQCTDCDAIFEPTFIVNADVHPLEG